jgi:hypothetical protein
VFACSRTWCDIGTAPSSAGTDTNSKPSTYWSSWTTWAGEKRRKAFSPSPQDPQSVKNDRKEVLEKEAEDEKRPSSESTKEGSSRSSSILARLSLDKNKENVKANGKSHYGDSSNEKAENDDYSSAEDGSITETKETIRTSTSN